MNRVRIVAVTAVALGAAVVAGTHLQQGPVAAPSVGEPAVAQAPGSRVAVPSLAGLAADPSAPVALRAATVAGPLVQSEAPVATASVLPSVDLPGALPLPSADPLAERVALAESAAVADGTPVDAPSQPIDPQMQAELNACAVWLVVTPAAGAMLETSVYAPCDADARVTLSHAGLAFDARIGADGQMMVQIPALTEEASVTLIFADGREQRDATLVPDLAGIERVALHWRAPATLALHAYEFGADYGQPGHVHAGSAAVADGISQGVVTPLGDPSMIGSHLAQVYSYPRGASPRQGLVTLEIEIPVTDASCGGPLTVDAIEVHGTTSAQVRQIRIDMPECDGNGGYLVLPGVLPELQIAMN